MIAPLADCPRHHAPVGRRGQDAAAPLQKNETALRETVDFYRSIDRFFTLKTERLIGSGRQGRESGKPRGESDKKVRIERAGLPATFDRVSSTWQTRS